MASISILTARLTLTVRGVPDSDNLPGSGGSCVSDNSTAPLLVEFCTIDYLRDMTVDHTLYSTLCYETMEEWIATDVGGFRRAHASSVLDACGDISSDLHMVVIFCRWLDQSVTAIHPPFASY